jgi:hypothetical protein
MDHTVTVAESLSMAVTRPGPRLNFLVDYGCVAAFEIEAGMISSEVFHPRHIYCASTKCTTATTGNEVFQEKEDSRCR